MSWAMRPWAIPEAPGRTSLGPVGHVVVLPEQEARARAARRLTANGRRASASCSGVRPAFRSCQRPVVATGLTAKPAALPVGGQDAGVVAHDDAAVGRRVARVPPRVHAQGAGDRRAAPVGLPRRSRCRLSEPEHPVDVGPGLRSRRAPRARARCSMARARSASAGRARSDDAVAGAGAQRGRRDAEATTAARARRAGRSGGGRRCGATSSAAAPRPTSKKRPVSQPKRRTYAATAAARSSPSTSVALTRSTRRPLMSSPQPAARRLRAQSVSPRGATR